MNGSEPKGVLGHEHRQRIVLYLYGKLYKNKVFRTTEYACVLQLHVFMILSPLHAAVLDVLSHSSVASI